MNRLHAFLFTLVTVLVGCGDRNEPLPPEPVGTESGVVSGEVASATPQVENVIVISLDTLRADRLESFGYGRMTSPNIGALARRGVVFERVQAQAAQTAPSHASLFTGEYVGAHGIRNVHSGHAEMFHVPDGMPMLAEMLQEGGIETGAFVSGGNLTRRMGMNRGFDSWNETNEDVSGRIDALLTWVLNPNRGRFFAFMHTYQVHAPYLPPKEIYPQFVDPDYSGPLEERLKRYLAMPPAEAWAGGVGPDYWDGMLEYTDADVRFLSDLYDAEIAYLDRQLRRVIEVVLTSDLAQNTALIVLSDHGEEFREHGKFQHDQLYEQLVHVPMIVRLPTALERDGWKGRVKSPVELVDVAPTVIDLMGVETEEPAWIGRSLVPLLGPDRAGAADASRPQFSEMTVDPGPKLYRTVTWQGWKYIHVYQLNIDKTWERLFHLDADPGERDDLIASTDARAAEMLDALRKMLDAYTRENTERNAKAGPRGTTEVDAKTAALLKALGYVGDDGAPADPVDEEDG